jgi:hypothetical protein
MYLPNIANVIAASLIAGTIVSAAIQMPFQEACADNGNGRCKDCSGISVAQICFKNVWTARAVCILPYKCLEDRAEKAAHCK